MDKKPNPTTLKEFFLPLLESEEGEDPKPRLLRAGYMALKKEATGFVCGECKWFDTETSQCSHKEVDTEVDGKHGCCNHFYPGSGEPEFGEQH